jgi:DUF1009 family protein
MTTFPTLGIIAGGGVLPALVAETGRNQGRTVVAVGFPDDTDPDLPRAVDHFTWLKLGQLGKLISFFKKHGVQEVVLAGSINKPRALNIRPDFRAARLLFSLKRRSDDSLLRVVASELQKEGMSVVSAQPFAPQLATPAGILTKTVPTREQWKEIFYGWPIARDLGRHDIGQSLIVKEQMVIAVEAIEGTDATIRRGGELGGAGCTLIKVFKPGQDNRIDLPSIGLNTVRLLAEARGTCLAVEAEKSLFFDKEEAVRFADQNGITIVGVTAKLLREYGVRYREKQRAPHHVMNPS